MPEAIPRAICRNCASQNVAFPENEGNSVPHCLRCGSCDIEELHVKKGREMSEILDELKKQAEHGGSIGFTRAGSGLWVTVTDRLPDAALPRVIAAWHQAQNWTAAAQVKHIYAVGIAAAQEACPPPERNSSEVKP